MATDAIYMREKQIFKYEQALYKIAKLEYDECLSIGNIEAAIDIALVALGERADQTGHDK
jgi:hypothetical protein